jgi:hypothetical protein
MLNGKDETFMNIFHIGVKSLRNLFSVYKCDGSD